jgi:hypothetical protein
VVRVLVDGSSVLPAAHEEGGELFGWLGVVGGDWGFAGFCLEPAGLRRVSGDVEMSVIGTYLSNSGTFCWSSRMTRKLPSFAHAGWSMVSPSCPQMIILR